MFSRGIKRFTKFTQCNVSLMRNALSTADLMKNRIVWIDMEMTGLSIETDQILEIACVITDKNLNILHEVPNIVIHQENSVLNKMHNWCKIHHGQSGLIQESRDSKISLDEAQHIILDNLKMWVLQQESPLAGNSVYMDRLFLYKYMPLVNDYLHYRIIDVSTIKELARRWNPCIYYAAPEKKHVHRAQPDIKASIEELSYYKRHMFLPECV